MAIYDEKKMKQKEVYPTEQTPSYADWALFEMGKQLEAEGTCPEIPEPELSDAGKVVKVNDQGEYALAEDDVGTRLMAGTGIEIVNDTINNTAPVPAYDTSDDGKILGVTVDTSGETPVAEVGWVEQSGGLPAISSGDAGKVLAVNSGETGTEWVNGINCFVVGTSSSRAYQENYTNIKTGETVTVGSLYQISLKMPVFIITNYNSTVSGVTSRVYTYSYKYGSGKPHQFTCFSESWNISYPDSEGNPVGEYYTMCHGEYTISDSKEYKLANVKTGKICKARITNVLYNEPTSSDIRKVLTVNSTGDGAEWADVPTELPTISSGDAGKVLTVNSGETGTEWATPSGGLPAIASGDAGKILAVNSGETGSEWVAKGIDGFDYVNYHDIRTSSTVNKNQVGTVNVNMSSFGGQAYDYIIYTTKQKANCMVLDSIQVYTNTLNISFVNTGDAIPTNELITTLNIYRRPKQGTANKAIVVGNVGENCVRAKELPATLGTAGQVLAVNSDATGVEWKDPTGMKAHVYTTWGAFVTAYIEHMTDCIVAYIGGHCNFTLSVVAGTPYSCKFIRTDHLYLTDDTIREINYIFTETADSTNTNASMKAKGFTYNPSTNTFTAYNSDIAGQATVTQYILYY